MSILDQLRQKRQWYRFGRDYLQHHAYRQTTKLTELEQNKQPTRTVIINQLIQSLGRKDVHYLEIGVRNPAANFDGIQAAHKYSVDPGVEFKANPVMFQMTSDAFFEKKQAGELLSPDLKFDVIFVDGLHLADQVERDIDHALAHLAGDGFVVLHDCNPPTQWHAREAFSCELTPARYVWNGTTWKAYYKARGLPGVQSCCIDSDWGVAVLCRHLRLGTGDPAGNPFFEFQVMADHRQEHLNLMSYDAFCKLLPKT